MSIFKRIPSFVAGRPIVDPKTGAPTAEFLRALNDNLANITTSGIQLGDLVEDIVATLAQANIALTTAEAAAAAAQAAIANQSLVDSYTDPVALLTAEVDPGDATKAKVTVAGHNRIYGNGTSVPVTGGSQAGLLLSTTYSVYYVQPAMTGGAVSYLFTTDFTLAVQGQNNGTHFCGYVTTPGSGGPPIIGDEFPPFGFFGYPNF